MKCQTVHIVFSIETRDQRLSTAAAKASKENFLVLSQDLNRVDLPSNMTSKISSKCQQYVLQRYLTWNLLIIFFYLVQYLKKPK